MFELTQQDRILQIRLARPPVNALNRELLAGLAEQIENAPGRGAEAIVLAGNPGLFSAGLDIPELLRYDAAGLSGFLQTFFAALSALARAPLPVVAAFTGHSPAGGTVLGLFCDYRVMAAGDFKLGLNEVEVGLVVPPLVHRALARLLGGYRAERHLLDGRMIGAEQALAIGLVDELAPVEEVTARATAWCREHLALPRQAFLGTRRLARANLVALFNDETTLGVETFVSEWFSAATQNTLQELIARLKAKREEPRAEEAKNATQ